MAGGDPLSGTAAHGSPAEQHQSTRPNTQLPEHVRAELVRRVADELARFGAVGEPFLENGELMLRHPTGLKRTPLGLWVADWERMDEATRRMRIGQAVRALTLSLSLRPASSRAVAPPTSLTWVWRIFMALGLLLLAWFAVGRARNDHGPTIWRRPVALSATASAGSSARARTPADQTARASLVCAATRARVVRGATVTIADAEGWVVEYMALRADATTPLAGVTALTTFFSPRGGNSFRYTWPEEPELSGPGASTDGVVIHEEGLAPSGDPRTVGLRVTFSGALVDAYFRPEARARYFHLASALSDALGATHAGLYARCADGETHHLGSWFRGSSHHEATAALIYMLGTYAEPPHLSAPHSRPIGAAEIDRSFALRTIARVSTAIDRPLLAGLIGRQGGMVMGGGEQPVTLTFPFDDGNRASRLSREIARLTQIGGE